jgi:hypothetical protein
VVGRRKDSGHRAIDRATQQNAAQRKSPVFMRLWQAASSAELRTSTQEVASPTDTRTDTRFHHALSDRPEICPQTLWSRKFFSTLYNRSQKRQEPHYAPERAPFALTLAATRSTAVCSMGLHCGTLRNSFPSLPLASFATTSTSRKQCHMLARKPKFCVRTA